MAAEKVKVIYEELPAYLTFMEAAAKDAIRVHEQSPNVYIEQPLFKGGDTREIFETSEYSVEGSFSTTVSRIANRTGHRPGILGRGRSDDDPLQKPESVRQYSGPGGFYRPSEGKNQAGTEYRRRQLRLFDVGTNASSGCRLCDGD